MVGVERHPLIRSFFKLITVVTDCIFSEGKFIRLDELESPATMGNEESVHRQAIKNEHRKSLKGSLIIEFSPDGLDLHKTITPEDLKGPDEQVWDWFELWIDFSSDGEDDASWRLTFSEPVTRLDLARRIQQEYLETYPDDKRTPYLRRLVQSESDPAAFTVEIIRI